MGIKKPSHLTGRFNFLLYVLQLTLPPLPSQPHWAILKGILFNHTSGDTVNLLLEAAAILDEIVRRLLRRFAPRDDSSRKIFLSLRTK